MFWTTSRPLLTWPYALQWGRGQLTADDQVKDGNASLVYVLQWGRGQLTADDILCVRFTTSTLPCFNGAAVS